MAKDVKASVADLIVDATKRSEIQVSKYITTDLGLPTLEDIVAGNMFPDEAAIGEVKQAGAHIKKAQDIISGVLPRYTEMQIRDGE
jgi:uncharacterized protein